MRDIKFRGKVIDNGISVLHKPACRKTLVNGEWSIGEMFSKGSPVIGYCGEWYAVDPETVGQYTGLKDMEDTEAYEADILKDEHEELYVIRWSDHWGGFCLAKPSGRFADGKIYYSSHNPIYSGLGSYNILGNIHDNPELLPGTKL